MTTTSSFIDITDRYSCLHNEMLLHLNEVQDLIVLCYILCNMITEENPQIRNPISGAEINIQIGIGREFELNNNNVEHKNIKELNI